MQISEWWSPDFKDPMIMVFGLLPMLAGAACMLRYKKNQVFEVVLLLAADLLFLRSVRFELIMLMANTLVVCKHLPPRKPEKIYAVIWAYFSIMSVFLIASCMAVFEKGVQTKENISEDFYAAVKAKCGERPYNCYNLGQEMAYFGISCFIDSRYYPYRGEIMDDYNHVMRVDSQSQEMEQFQEKYGFTSYVVPENSAVYYYAIHHGFSEECRYTNNMLETDIVFLKKPGSF